MPKEQDKILNCEECKEDFEYTAGEQRFFAMKGFKDPKRCGACRHKRRRDRDLRDMGL